jgi:hypothetical protein
MRMLVVRMIAQARAAVWSACLRFESKCLGSAAVHPRLMITRRAARLRQIDPAFAIPAGAPLTLVREVLPVLGRGERVGHRLYQTTCVAHMGQGRALPKPSLKTSDGRMLWLTATM